MSVKPWTKSDRFYWLHARNNMERWYQCSNTCMASQGSFQRARGEIAASWLPCTTSQSGQRFMPLLTRRHQQWLMTNLCHFGDPRELRSDQGQNFWVTAAAGTVMVPQSVQDVYYPYASTVRCMVERCVKIVEEDIWIMNNSSCIIIKVLKLMWLVWIGYVGWKRKTIHAYWCLVGKYLMLHL
jgi:hypothetical protein